MKILDTNILIFANDPYSAVDKNVPVECLEQCALLVQQIQQSGCIVLDEDGEIINEYMNNLGHAGKPGLGAAFAKWVFNNQFSSPNILRVDVNSTHITTIDALLLQSCDPSDKKFLYTSRSSGASIVQSADCKWLLWETLLFQQGVALEYICRNYLLSKLTIKFPKHGIT